VDALESSLLPCGLVVPWTPTGEKIEDEGVSLYLNPLPQGARKIIKRGIYFFLLNTLYNIPHL
jgi:hypothetical protein